MPQGPEGGGRPAEPMSPGAWVRSRNPEVAWEYRTLPDPATETTGLPPRGSAEEAPISSGRRPHTVLGGWGLAAMVTIILVVTVGAIVIEHVTQAGAGPFRVWATIGPRIDRREVQVIFHVQNAGRKAGKPADQCDANLVNAAGNRVGTAGITIVRPVPAHSTATVVAIGVTARTPTQAQVTCSQFTPE